MQFIYQRHLLAGPGLADAQAASIRADHPVPADCGLYLYEVKIISSGKQGFIGEEKQLGQPASRGLGVHSGT